MAPPGINELNNHTLMSVSHVQIDKAYTYSKTEKKELQYWYQNNSDVNPIWHI